MNICLYEVHVTEYNYGNFFHRSRCTRYVAAGQYNGLATRDTRQEGVYALRRRRAPLRRRRSNVREIFGTIVSTAYIIYCRLTVSDRCWGTQAVVLNCGMSLRSWRKNSPIVLRYSPTVPKSALDV